MTRYWVVAPFESQPADQFEKAWQFDIKNNVISIGFSEEVDVSKVDRFELSTLVSKQYSDKPKQTLGLITNMLWAFYHEIRVGDIVLARRGRKILEAVGTVSGQAIYDPGRNADISHPHFLPVVWHPQPRSKDFGTVVFPMHTLAEIDEHQFDSLVEGTGFEAAENKEDVAQGNQAQFVLEKYLEEFIVSNFDSIFYNELSLYRDSEGNTGQQYQTDIGYIDILAKDQKDDSFVVIELKKGQPSDKVFGQIMRYMGWVKENLAGNNQPVKGLVICRDEDIKMNYALKLIQEVDVRYYNVSFSLHGSPSHVDDI